MKRCLAALIAASLLAASALAAEPAEQGIQVDKMSILRKLVPETELEQAAQQQYLGLTQEARQKGVPLPGSARIWRS